MKLLHCTALLLLATAAQTFCMDADPRKRPALQDDSSNKRQRVEEENLVDLCKHWITAHPEATEQMNQMMEGVLAQTLNTDISRHILETIDPVYINNHFAQLVTLTSPDDCNPEIKECFAKRLSIHHIISLIRANKIDKLSALRCLELLTQDHKNIAQIIKNGLPFGTDSSVTLLAALVEYPYPNFGGIGMQTIYDMPKITNALFLSTFCSQEIERLKNNGDARWQELRNKLDAHSTCSAVQSE